MALCGGRQPKGEAAALHEWEDEARRGALRAVAEQRQQVRVVALAEDGNLALELGEVRGVRADLRGRGRPSALGCVPAAVRVLES